MSAPECIVFVIDDDPLVRESVADLLNSAGFTVQTFGSATEFVQAANTLNGAGHCHANTSTRFCSTRLLQVGVGPVGTLKMLLTPSRWR